jgi:tellurite resistance protein TehA-like permease
MRIVRYPRRVLEDVAHHGRAPGFFTAVAATCVLGSQSIVIARAWTAAAALWILGIVLWAVLTYTIFAVLTVKEKKPTLAEGINGGWLLAVVAAQSVAVLGAQVASGLGSGASGVLFFSLLMWLGGGMLYIWIISLIFYRYTFFTMSPADLAPPYWINMGAMAISTLAGSLLIINAPDAPFLQELLPFLKGFTVFYWATGTWWIPMLVLLALWRYVHQRFPLRYDPLYWGAVFPLGMYAAATHEMVDAMGFRFLGFLPVAFLYLSVAAWAAALTGLARDLRRARAAGA